MSSLTDFTRRASGLFVPKPLRFAPGYPCCCGTPIVSCSDCPDGAPTEYEAVIIDVTDNGCGGGECVAINDTYILTFASAAPLWPCTWVYEGDACTCGGSGVKTLTMVVDRMGTIPEKIHINLYIKCGNGGSTIGNWNLQTTDLDCMFDALVVNGTSSSAVDTCTTVGSTCTLTAL